MERGNFDLEYLGSQTDDIRQVWHMYKVRKWNENNTKYDENCIYLNRKIDIKDIGDLDLGRLLYHTTKNTKIVLFQQYKYSF